MKDHWKDVRELAENPGRVFNENPKPLLDRILADADALLAGNREARAQLDHLLLWLMSDLSALNRRELLEAVRRIAKDALAALPKHLRK